MGIRTRFAPSPTGNLHIGGARSALFNYLFAKQNQGVFVLRIDDTDVERSKPEFEKDILESFKWLGINWDEGPFRQSERLDIYENYLKKLLEENKAYYCFCAEDALEAQRQDQMSRGEAPKYIGTCRDLSKEEIEKNLKEKKPFVIRFKVEPKKIKFKDIIRGEIEFDMNLVGDIIIAKNLATPLYNFTSVIDDFEMKISHVIRGEEHLSNTPKQILLQEALGFTRPEYAHLPMILASDRSKMSKREGATAVSDYRKEGYLPEALVNFMAFLGWNPGDEREIYSLASLVKEFSLEKVQKGGAVFNIKRLDFLNGFYIRQRSPEKLAELCLPYLGEIKDMKYLQKIVLIYQERLKKLSEIKELAGFFFEDINYDRGLLKWKDMEDKEIKQSLEKSKNILEKIKEDVWEKENLENILMPEAEKGGDRGRLLWPLRAALTGQKASAGPFDVAGILGRGKTLERIKQAIDLLD
ncbi:MAG: glutamate--tRNA ligase [bacterium]|nr:glutamate--tRNA ligase [bacterium]